MAARARKPVSHEATWCFNTLIAYVLLGDAVRS
jgi:hypothetical protein